MQPCGVCGGLGIDPAGYCTRCRTYRGLPQPQPATDSPVPPAAYPQSYELLSPGPYPGPVSAEPYQGPTSGGGYGVPGPTSGAGSAAPGGYPTPSGHPAPGSAGLPTPAPAGYPVPASTPGAGTVYGGPTSGAPYPSSRGVSYPPGTYGSSDGGAGYAPTAVPPPSRGRGSLVVPLLALSGVLVLLVVAIVVVVVVKAGAKGDGGGNAAGADRTVPAGQLVDACVVGDWEEISHDEGAPIEQIGEVRFTGHGAKLRMKADGTGVTDYGNGVTYTGSGTLASSGQTVTISLKVSGTINFEYRTNNGAMSFTNVQAHGSAVATVNGQEVGSQPLDGDSNPANYTCDGDVMKQTNSVSDVEWHRKS
jgi:hypothetical protein